MKAIMSVDYYKKVYERFNRHLNIASENEIGSQKATYSSTSNMQPPSNRSIWWKTDNIKFNKKRNIKNVLKEHQAILDNFIMAKTCLTNRSKEVYRQIWEDFLIFSQSIDLNAVSKYIRWKFQLSPNLNDKEITLEGTALKYESILSQFLNHIGIKQHKNFKHKHYIKLLFKFTFLYIFNIFLCAIIYWWWINKFVHLFFPLFFYTQFIVFFIYFKIFLLFFLPYFLYSLYPFDNFVLCI